MIRRAGDSRIVKARKKPWMYLTARRCQGSPSRSAVLIPRAKKRYASGVSYVKSLPRSSFVKSFVYVSKKARGVDGMPKSIDTSREYPEFLADLPEHIEGILQVVAGVGGRDDGPQTCLAAGDRREADALREHAFLEQPVRHLRRERGVADDDRSDRAGAQAGIEA